MATQRTSTIGKWLVINSDSLNAETFAGNIAVVIDRWVNGSRAGENRTSLAIFEGQPEFDEMITVIKGSDPASTTLSKVVEDCAKLLLPDCNNRKLSAVFGVGVC